MRNDTNKLSRPANEPRNGPDGFTPSPGPNAAHGPVYESIFKIMQRYSWMIIGCVVLALILGFVYLSQATPIFTSTSNIYIEQNGPKIMGDTEDGVMMGSKNYLFTQAELLKASPILSEALKLDGMQDLQTFSSVTNRLGLLKKSLETVVGSKDDILRVSFSSPFPEEAAHIVNSTVDAYVTFHATSKRSTALEVLKILQKEKEKQNQTLDGCLQTMMDYREEHDILASQTDQGNAVLDRLNRLSQALTEAQLLTLEAKFYYESAQGMAENPAQLRQFVESQKNMFMGLPNSPIMQLEAKLDAMRNRRIGRTQELTERHPAVQALDEKIRLQEKEIEQLDQEYARHMLVSLEQQCLNAQEKEQQLASYYEAQKALSSDLSLHLSKYTILQSEYERAKRMCEILDTRIKELNVTEDAGALNITILEIATAAIRPSEPQRAQVMVKALVLGLMLGCGLALLRQRMDQRLRSAEEASVLLGSALLGSVPAMGKRLSVSQRGQRVDQDSDSLVAEAYRTIRTAIFFSVPQDQACIIQVTSPMTGTGKSTLISNIGIAMAQSGQRVLIVDADLRRPTQHSIFQVERDRGLSGVLAGMQKLSQSFVRTPTDKLYLLPCGPEVPNPAEILGSEAFRDLLQRLASKFDRVLVDSPPVLPVTDGSILAAVCDATVCVLRAEKSTRKALIQTRSTLSNVGGRVIGAVMNDVKHSKESYGYGYGYSQSGPKKDQTNRKIPIRKKKVTPPIQPGVVDLEQQESKPQKESLVMGTKV